MNETLKGLKKLKADYIFLKLQLTLQTEEYSKDEEDLFSFHDLNGKEIDDDTISYLENKASKSGYYLTIWHGNIVLSTNDFLEERKKEKRSITNEEIKKYSGKDGNVVNFNFNEYYNNEQNIGGKK